MPLFEYSCADCGGEFEKIVPSYKTPVACDRCQSTRVEKKLSVFAVAGGGSAESPAEGGCGTCGAERPGMCQM
jgi:putative FmdB family regulatory protein